jgi:membrane-associated phospholipid phosphatase
MFHRAAFILMLLPLVVAAFVAGSRIHDWRHHPWDVTAGFGLGSIVAACMVSRVAAELDVLDSGGGGGGGGGGRA